MPVVDASVVVDWVAPGRDPASPAMRALSRLAEDGARLIAPRLLFEEVGNALLTGVRRGRWDGADADGAWELVRDLPVRLVDDSRDVERAWELARRLDNHPIYDLVYVALAERASDILVTGDLALTRRLGTRPWVMDLTRFLRSRSDT